jgi:signal transduction histidine kinase
LPLRAAFDRRPFSICQPDSNERGATPCPHGAQQKRAKRNIGVQFRPRASRQISRPDRRAAEEQRMNVYAVNDARSVVDARQSPAARAESREPSALDVNDLVTDALRLIAVDARKRNVTLRTNLHPGLPRVNASRARLQQVLLWLMANAIESMARARPLQRRLVLETRRAAGGVEVTVKDAARELVPTELSTRGGAPSTWANAGAVVGLAIARSIVEAHQGRIWREPHGGCGATFHVTLPSSAVGARVSRGCRPRIAVARWADCATRSNDTCTL